MAKFISGEELEKVIYDIIWDAKKTLLIVSPFIKLDDYFKRLFDNHANNPSLHLIIVFGKNEGSPSKSLSKIDFEYFKKFLNISIIYVPNLHAKYYGNKTKGVISSINLYDYSFKNNIEFGVYSKVNMLNKLITTEDQKAWNTCIQIAENNEAVFIKRPVYEKKLIITKNYIKSDVLHDITENMYNLFNPNAKSQVIKRINDFPKSLELGSKPSERPNREKFEKPNIGFCIRTGVRIPFNPNRPLSEESYKVWAKYGEVDFPENYCHKTGRPSNGKTSFNHPIL
ncbi:MAG TPA: phospholipase D family protein [Bacteroidales bacterium]|nr:phospholipase D family protein [Bacteroidales bacterium]